jgi:hypothetical protein
MDVIVVDEEHRQPIQRPSLTVVIDVYSRMGERGKPEAKG